MALEFKVLRWCGGGMTGLRQGGIMGVLGMSYFCILCHWGAFGGVFSLSGSFSDY
jgi:hypothetical protein